MEESTQSSLLTKDKTLAALDFLRNRFPNTFFPIGQIKYALAVGIRQEINACLKHPDGTNDLPENLSFKRISAAICLYCHHPDYQILIKTAGVKRVDLNGNIVGEVTEEQAQSFKDRRNAKPQTTHANLLNEPLNAKKYMAVIPVRSVKVTIPILSSNLPHNLRLPSKTPETNWKIELANPKGAPLTITAQTTSKAHQRMLKTVQDYETSGKEVWILLQATLLSNHVLKAPQLLVVEKKEKGQTG